MYPEMVLDFESYTGQWFFAVEGVIMLAFNSEETTMYEMWNATADWILKAYGILDPNDVIQVHPAFHLLTLMEMNTGKNNDGLWGSWADGSLIED